MKQYFAGEETAELAHHLENKMTEWSGFINRNGIIQRWIKSYRLYYGRHFRTGHTISDSEILRGGKEGELTLLTVNHYRNLIKHTLVMTTNQKPAFDVRAINSDLKSLQQAKLGNNILDAYLKEQRLGRYLAKAAEHALVFGKGFVKCVWDPSLGKPYTAEEKLNDLGESSRRIIYEGDVDVSCPSPFDVLVDPTQEDWNKCEWVMIRSYRNKFNLAVRYPDLQTEIENLPSKSDIDGTRFITLQSLDETADVPVYEFYHKRTEALPNGRYMLFCNGKTVLYDGAIPYKKLPIFRIVPGEVFGTTEGYSDAFDLMPIQEAINVLYSTILSNQNAFGTQNILMPNGCNISREQLADSLAVISYDPAAGKPEALQLTATPAEVFKFLEIIERVAETLSGVNSVARGNPESSLKSGVALGLIQSMAVQYASGFQQSWAELLEDTGTFILDLLKIYASTPRMVAMAGKYQRGQMSEFVGSDLENIDRVVVELGNPMSRTTAGRVEIANNLLQQGLIKTPQEYLNVMNTGNLDPLTEGAEAQIALIRKENEQMMDGGMVSALVGDAHLLHAQEHLALLANPLIRQSSPVIQNILAHIQQHKQLRETQDPFFSIIAGEPPAPPPPMPMQGPPPMPMAQPGPMGPPHLQAGPPHPQAGPPHNLKVAPRPMPPHPLPPGPPMPGAHP